MIINVKSFFIQDFYGKETEDVNKNMTVVLLVNLLINPIFVNNKNFNI